MADRRILIAGLAVIAAGAGTAGAIAATSSGDRKQAESEILADAAQRLDVTPRELRDALDAAQSAHLDELVEDGKLTEEQAEAIRKHRAQEGTVLGRGAPHPGLGRGFGHPRPRHPGLGRRGLGRLLAPIGDIADAAADALGISDEELHERIHDGESLEEIAQDEGKRLADVKDAVEAEVGDQLDEAVKDGKLTDAQRDALRKRFDAVFDRIAENGLPGMRGLHRGFR